jgi:hypothetical protein
MKLFALNTQANKKPFKAKKNTEPYKPVFEVPKPNDPEWSKGLDGNAWKSYRHYIINKFMHKPWVKPVNEAIKKINPNWALKEKPLIVPDRHYVTSWNNLTYNQYNRANIIESLFPRESAELSRIYKFPEEDEERQKNLVPYKEFPKY